MRLADRKRWPQRYTEEAKRKARSRRLMREYGITQDDYDRMYAQQKGRCAICNVAKPSGGLKGLHVDHCHMFGHVRGLLCLACNLFVGILENVDGAYVRLQEHLAR